MNSTPYHSADNGFACAAAGRGITEALQNHLNVIVRNEELEIEISDSQIQADINALVEDKERLEQQKLDRQENIHVLTEELSEKDVKLAKLNAKLENPLSTSAITPQPRIQELNKEINENILELDEKKVTQVKIQTDLEAPTEVELDPASVGKIQISAKRRLSIPDGILASLLTFAIIGLAFYLIIFYASVGDRTFTAGSGAIGEKKDNIIIPNVFFEAWESPQNWFVITFPFIFLTLAFLVHFCYEHKRWRMFGGLLGATLLIDSIIAVKISKQIHKFIKGESVPYTFGGNWLEILSVLFLGFGVSLLLGFGLLWVMKIWRGEKPHSDETGHLEMQKRSEQNDRLIQLNALTADIQNLETKVNALNEEKEKCEKHIEETAKQQHQVKIAHLKIKKEKLQMQIDNLNEQVESLQKEINQCEAEIKSLLKRQSSKGIDLKKLEANAYEFVDGWCKYVAQSRNALSNDVSNQIKDIQSLANETLETYKLSLPTT